MSKAFSPLDNSGTPFLVALRDNAYVNRIEFRHFARDIFNIALAYQIPEQEANPSEPIPYPFVDPPSAEFVIDHGSKPQVSGLALFGVWGAGPGVLPPTGNTVRDKAEVWFDRI